MKVATKTNYQFKQMLWYFQRESDSIDHDDKYVKEIERERHQSRRAMNASIRIQRKLEKISQKTKMSVCKERNHVDER